MTSQLVIFRAFFQLVIFRAAFFSISRTISKTSKISQQSVLNLQIFHNFPKNLHITFTFNSVTLKNTRDKTSKINYCFQRNK